MRSFSLVLFLKIVIERLKLLTPAYVVRGKVIFILEIVCLFTIGWVGYPIPGPGEGVPHPRSRWRVPHPGDRGYPIQLMGGGTPSQVQAVLHFNVGVPHARSRWGGISHQDDQGGTTSQVQARGIPSS